MVHLCVRRIVVPTQFAGSHGKAAAPPSDVPKGWDAKEMKEARAKFEKYMNVSPHSCHVAIFIMRAVLSCRFNYVKVCSVTVNSLDFRWSLRVIEAERTTLII